MRALSAGLGLVLVGAVVGAFPPARLDVVEPVVSVRYRGSGAGAPVLDDLAAIRAVGFESVTWPERQRAGLADVRRMAELVGLQVLVKPDPVPLSATAAKTPGLHVDVRVGSEPRVLTPLVWRAIAHGARSIAFDPDVAGGAGLTRADGSAAPWLAPAITIARHLSANQRLVDVMRPGPRVTIAAPAPAGLDVVLLDGGRAWVIVATSLSPRPEKATAIFPKGVPYGLWASWLDDSGMSMLGLPSGPRWSLELEGYGTRVYFIDKSSISMSKVDLSP